MNVYYSKAEIEYHIASLHFDYKLSDLIKVYNERVKIIAKTDDHMLLRVSEHINRDSLIYVTKDGSYSVKIYRGLENIKDSLYAGFDLNFKVLFIIDCSNGLEEVLSVDYPDYVFVYNTNKEVKFLFYKRLTDMYLFDFDNNQSNKLTGLKDYLLNGNIARIFVYANNTLLCLLEKGKQQYFVLYDLSKNVVKKEFSLNEYDTFYDITEHDVFFIMIKTYIPLLNKNDNTVDIYDYNGNLIKKIDANVLKDDKRKSFSIDLIKWCDFVNNLNKETKNNNIFNNVRLNDKINPPNNSLKIGVKLYV